MNDFSFKAKIRKRSPETANASWHMVNVSRSVSKKISKIQETLPMKRGWKSMKVKVRIGFYDRETSVFPSKETGTYVLPIKKEARKELRVGEGDEVFVVLELI